MTDTSGGPTTLTQLVTTHGDFALHLAFDYRFLTNAGSFQVLLDNTVLATLPAVQSTDFTHFDSVLTDPALRGLDVADLNLRLLPGSLAAVQLDNVVFQLAAVPGDFNGDGQVTGADIQAMLSALVDLNKYKSDYDLTSADLTAIGDFDNSGSVTNRDIQGLLDLVISLGGGSAAAVPEPSTLCLLIIGAGAMIVPRRHK